MRKIVVLSGKGGTGKTSITSSLAVILSRSNKLVVVDCDVDTPNLGLVLGVKKDDFNWKKVYESEKVVLDHDKCTGCKKCLSICNFDVISWGDGVPVFNKFLCEGCGACSIVCPEGAVSLERIQNGFIGSADTSYGFKIVSGRLLMGASGSGKIVDLIRERASGYKADLVLLDAPAGIGCPVIASVRGADYALLVTEPTPSAFSDLKRAVKLLKQFNIPAGLIINKSDINKGFNEKIKAFAKEKGVRLLSEVPYDYAFVDSLVNLKPVVVYDNSFEKYFKDIMNNNS
ncbi:P-loop NTPase [archaeon]|nr:P-loop NTPase [archaeon]